MSSDHQRAVFAAMLVPAAYPHPVDAITVQDTHISRVFLTGRWAYKIKKAVDLGFLDFSTLDLRHHFCRREVELNRRLTEGVYRGVVAIVAHKGGYRLAGEGPAVEYAVRMRQLPGTETLSARLRNGVVDAGLIRRLVAFLLDFYAGAVRVPPDSKRAIWQAVREACRNNLQAIGTHPCSDQRRRRLERIQMALEHHLTTHKVLFSQRIIEGRVIDGHGDLRGDHLYFESDGSMQVIDCIEFNDRLRRIDIISDLAFLTMDLDHKGHPQWADLVMQTYAETSGDAAGLAWWPFYQCYRALVRCKVNLINAQRAGTASRRGEICQQAARRYLRQAESFAIRLETPVLVAMCGGPGTGKSTLARALSQALAWPIYRSDVERRKGFGQPLRGGRSMTTHTAPYSLTARRQVYDRLSDQARSSLAQGQSVILDATFGRSIWRQKVRRLADSMDADRVFIVCQASRATIEARLQERETAPGVSEARLAHLPAIMAHYEHPARKRDVLEIETGASIDRCLAQILVHMARRSQRASAGPKRCTPGRERRMPCSRQF